eukprot:sb/3476369/
MRKPTICLVLHPPMHVWWSLNRRHQDQIRSPHMHDQITSLRIRSPPMIRSPQQYRGKDHPGPSRKMARHTREKKQQSDRENERRARPFSAEGRITLTSSTNAKFPCKMTKAVRYARYR